MHLYVQTNVFICVYFYYENTIKYEISKRTLKKKEYAVRSKEYAVTLILGKVRLDLARLF